MPPDASRPSAAATLAEKGGAMPAATLAGLSTTLGYLRVASGFLVASVVICGLYFGRDILVPLVLALLLAFMLDPVVARLRRWGLPRVPAVVLVVAATLALLVAAAALVGKEVRDLGTELPVYQSTIRNKLADLRESMRGPGVLDGLMETVDTVQREVERMAPPTRSGVQRVQIEERAASPFTQASMWLERASGPLVQAGIALVFVVLVLLDRLDLRDRLLRLVGGNLHRATDAMDEAGARISRYLGMQLVVNLSYGIPMALGLWLIGVPGAVLWGMLAAVLRFVPYVGPLISAVFPLTLAFAVDPGWSLLLWTLALIAVLELVSNNIVEPWLYGASTGLSALSLIVAATFWTALWGPVGLIMSTPLTVCLLVTGRYLPHLQFLDVLLGSQPALDAPTRMYQRLLAGEEDEAIALAEELTTAGTEDVPRFYDNVAVPALRLAVTDHARVATAEHRLRVVTGMEAVLDELEDDHRPADRLVGAAPDVLCLGGKWEVDVLAARMLAHGIGLHGTAAAHVPTLATGGDEFARLDLRGAQVVCLSWFSAQPQMAARQFCRRLRRRWPAIRIVLVLWNVPAQQEENSIEAAQALGADAIAASMQEAALRVCALLAPPPSEEGPPTPLPPNEDERLQALRASAALHDGDFKLASEHIAQRAADIFDVPMSQVVLIDEATEVPLTRHGVDHEDPPPPCAGAVPRADSLAAQVVGQGAALVVPDSARDPRFAAHPQLLRLQARFWAGAPVRDAKGHAVGVLCVLAPQPRAFDARDTRLLQALADDLARSLKAGEAQPAGAPVAEQGPPSATLGQAVPG